MHAHCTFPHAHTFGDRFATHGVLNEDAASELEASEVEEVNLK
jgi:hypothetical protein